MMTRKMVMAALLVVFGCSQGPNIETLRKDVTERLEKGAPAGVVAIGSLGRRGSAPDAKAPAGEDRRLIYFDAELSLAKDYDFGGWESPGVAGLVTALGTGPRGLVGIASGGNKAGDVIRAHGTAIYRREGERWAIVAAEGFQPTAATAFDTRTQRPAAEQLLKSIAKVLESTPPDVRPLALEVTEEELSQAHTAIRGRLARVSGGYSIAAGPENGQYLRLAQAFSAVGRVRLVALVTAGGEENLALLREGKVSFAMAQGDVARMAHEGTGPFTARGPDLKLTAVGSLYPEPVHVVARADGEIRSMADLRGKRVAIGVRGSASRITALAVLEAHNIRASDLAQAAELNLNDSLLALRDRQIDAFLQVIGAPADSLRSAAVAFPLRFVPLEAAAVGRLSVSAPGVFSYTLPAGTYEGQTQNTPTAAVAALLLVHSDLTGSEVERFTRALYSRGQDFAARGSVQAAQISAGKALMGLVVPLHPGAARALDELKSPVSAVSAPASPETPAK
jgi:TRAP transporter TAXI family solute receptor